MLELKNIDLTTDPAAASDVKTEVVSVTFARQDGELLSLEGPNRYAVGDALHGNAGDWLLQHAPGDFGIADQSRFAQVYRKVG